MTEGKRRRLPAAERRAQIIEAAREVFLEYGLAGTRTRFIAERAGITEAFLYRHFPSKDEIYQVAVHEPLEALVANLEQRANAVAVIEGASRRDQLRAINALMLEFMCEAGPFLAVALFSEVSKGKAFYQQELFPRIKGALVDVVEAVSGWPKLNIDADLVVNAMFGVHFGVALDHMLRDVDVDVLDASRQLTEMFISGIRDPDAPAQPVKRRSRARPAATPPAPAPATVTTDGADGAQQTPLEVAQVLSNAAQALEAAAQALTGTAKK